MTPLELLTKMRARLEKPEAWCQIFRALDGAGEQVDPDSDRACTWCLFGAMQSFHGERHGERLKQLCGVDSFMVFNDEYGRTHAEILALLDAGIERAKAVAS